MRELRNVPLVRLHRLKGIESVVLRGDNVVGRSALLDAMKLDPSLMFDLKVFSAFWMSFLPRSVAKALLAIRSRLMRA